MTGEVFGRRPEQSEDDIHVWEFHRENEDGERIYAPACSTNDEYPESELGHLLVEQRESLGNGDAWCDECVSIKNLN